MAAAFLFVRRHRAVALFAAAVGILAVANLAFPFFYPVLNGDANSYHLPRAYYWTTLGTARHFPTADFRMSEMPPDPSFVFAWIMALSGSFRGLHVPQWAAADGLGLRFEMGESRWAIRESRFVPDEEHSGFGPVGFVAFLLSPAVLLASAASWVRSRRLEPLVRGLLVVTALGWFVGFVFSGQPWMAELIRFFLLFIPLLIAALVAQGREARWGAVVGQFRNEAGQGWTLPGIPVPRNMVVVPDPRRPGHRAAPSR